MKKIPVPTFDTSFFSKLSIFITSFAIGLLVLLQWRSFSHVRQTVLRDRNPNIFREIQILKTVTEQLRQEIAQTKADFSEISTKTSSLSSLQDEFNRFQLLSGEQTVTGSGVRITIPEAIDHVWFVDLQNELMTAGAEALSLNGIRITAENVGFRFVPPQTILLGNVLLRPPFILEAIGDSKVLLDMLKQPGGIIVRLQKTIGKKEIVISEEAKLEFSGTRP